MFRNDRQRCDAVQVLLQASHLEHFWTDVGPTKTAVQYRDLGGGPLSVGERIILLAAFDLWDASANLAFLELLHTLDSKNASRLLSLIQAAVSGSWAVDEWISHESAQCHAAGSGD